jgi:Zn-dependent protease with chaperone function
VRLDTANRSFVALVAVAFLAYQLLGVAACLLLGVLGYRLAADGFSAVTNDGAELIPALLFLLGLGIGALLGIRSLVHQSIASVRLAERVRRLRRPAPSELDALAEGVRLGGRVRLVDSPACFSFAYGALSPRVAVSGGLFGASSESELRAVLVHERYHVRNLDPLKVLLARALPAALFYLPALRGLRDRYVAGRELAADRSAVAACGRTPLSEALMKVVRAPRWPEFEAAAAIGGPELLDFRVSQLEAGTEPPVPGVGWGAVGLSAVGAALLTGAFAASVAGSGGMYDVLQTTMPGMALAPLRMFGMVACALGWAVLGWLGYRWLSWRARRPIDTTHE